MKLLKYTRWIVLSSWLMACNTDVPEEVKLAFELLPAAIDYNTDIKPILSDRCYHCHGPDLETRKAGVRLDTKQGLFAQSESGSRPFVKGKIGKSEVINRILSDDPEYMMPPPSSHRNLSTKEKAALVKWVEQGAEWKEHWAYIPPVKADVPVVKADWRQVNELDHFIQHKLVQNGMQPSEEASKERLLRRVTIDLTGLPPTLEEQEAFLADNSADAYEKVVDRLLSSDAHAERLALEWLDLARYSDSHGFHADGERKMWPWRDWVIGAFQQNMPYDQFVTEQLAGDLLPNATKDQVMATAFNRNHPMTAEGGVVDEEFRLEYVSNRTNTLGTAFLGLTLECAKCHDHKFDPISQKEYYQISAFFNNIKELGMTGDDGDYGPMMLLTDDKLDETIAYIESELTDAKHDMVTIDQQKSPIFFQSFNELVKKDHQYFDGNKNAVARGDIDLADGISGMAPVFDHQDDFLELRNLGQFEAYEPFSVSMWVRLEKETGKTKVLIGNAGEKNTLWRGWDLYLDSANHLAFRLISSLPHNYFHVVTRESITLDEWVNVAVSYDGSMSAEGVELFINGNPTDQNIKFDNLYKSILPVTTTRERNSELPLRLARSYRGYTGDNGTFKGQLDELAIFDVAISSTDVVSVMNSTRLGKRPHAEAVKHVSDDLLALRKEKLALLDTVQELMVMQEMSQPRPTFTLKRGEYDKPMEQVLPGAINKVLAFEEDLEQNRLGLSKWLFDHKNPLTARVAVNRYWQMIFGRGIVATVNDFGSQGAAPTHPELLDWLAVQFMESGWDLRWLIKTMVMSHTYRQISVISPELEEKDVDNQWLARGPSYRFQAEFIRDQALASSGLLRTKIGGPSVKPYQPEGLWIELGNFSHFLKTYEPDRDESQYRRSMYTFVRRTSPPPNMTIFDAPNREVCTVTRERTNTPLQALVLLNDPQFVEASRALACRLKEESMDSVRDQIERGFKLVLSRSAEQEELDLLEKLYQDELSNFQNNNRQIKDFLSVGDFSVPHDMNKAEVAALTVVSSTLLNLDEAFTKR